MVYMPPTHLGIQHPTHPGYTSSFWSPTGVIPPFLVPHGGYSSLFLACFGRLFPVSGLFREIIPCFMPECGLFSLFYARMWVILPVSGLFRDISPCLWSVSGHFSLFYAPRTLFVGAPCRPSVRCAVLYVRTSRCVHGSVCRICTFDRRVTEGWDTSQRPSERCKTVNNGENVRFTGAIP